MAISLLKIRRPLGRLIFNMGIAIPGKTVFLIETAPCRELRNDVMGLLSPWGRDKMVVILQATFSRAFSSIKIPVFFIEISFRFVPNGLINNKSTFNTQLTAFRQTGDTTLSKRIVAKSTQAYLRNSFSMS